MSLLNLAWHQPLLIPLMGEALPQSGGEGRETARKRGRNAHVPIAGETWSREELGGSISQGLLD